MWCMVTTSTCSSSPHLHQQPPQQRPRARSNAAAPPPPPLAAPLPPPPPAPANPPAAASLPRPPLSPAPPPLYRLEPRPQRFVPPHDLRDTPLQRLHLQLSPQPHHRRYVVGPRPGSSCSMNHNRCCAYDSGSRPPAAHGLGTAPPSAAQASTPARRSGDDRRQASARALGPAARSRCSGPPRGSASPATLGCSNNARNGSSTGKVSRTRDTIWVASSECPPSSKKFSCPPTSPQSAAPPARSPPAVPPPASPPPQTLLRLLTRLRRRQPPPIHFPIGRQRQLLQPHEHRRHHVLRQPALR